MRCIAFFFLVLCSVWCTSLSCQIIEQIDEAAQSAYRTFDAPGFAIGVIQDGEVIMSNGYGHKKIRTTDPVDGATLFAIASNTKAFISTALGRLHEEGKLDLDSPVRRYLPYFTLYDEYVSEHTTVRDLLCHRVGLGTFSGDAIWYKSRKGAEDIIRQIQYLPQAYPWRGGYGYSNLMFITAGEVIHSVTGFDWDEYIKAHFLNPLGMDRTQTSVYTLDTMSNVATPHITHRNNQPIGMAQWEAPGAAGGIISCVDDMMLWMGAQMKAYHAEDNGIFPSAVIDQTMKPHNPLSRHGFSSAGLGWFLYARGGKTIVTHGGGYDGMYSRLILIPEMRTGIVVLSNSMTGLPSALARHIQDLYLELDTEGWLDRAIENETKGRATWKEKFVKARDSQLLGTRPSMIASEMVGAYEDPLYGEITISADRHDNLFLSFGRAPELRAALRHWHYDTWEIDWVEEHAWFDFGTVQFILDNNRRVTGLRFDVPNDDIFFEEIEAVKSID